MRQLRTMIPALAAMMGMVAPASAVESYDACLKLVAAAPQQAEAEADRWARAGGGGAARHCRALALVELGAKRHGAKLIVEVAIGDRTLPDTVRAVLLIEAGELFLGLGDLAAGRDVVSRALLLAPDLRAALSLSARLKAEKGDWQGAVDDLDGVLANGDPDAELLVLRASARLHLGQPVAARGDLSRATEIAPGLASVWLERGTLEAATADRDAARAAWLRAIELDRDGLVGAAARLRLQKLEAAWSAGGN